MQSPQLEPRAVHCTQIAAGDGFLTGHTHADEQGATQQQPADDCMTDSQATECRVSTNKVSSNNFINLPVDVLIELGWPTGSAAYPAPKKLHKNSSAQLAPCCAHLCPNVILDKARADAAATPDSTTARIRKLLCKQLCSLAYLTRLQTQTR